MQLLKKLQFILGILVAIISAVILAELVKKAFFTLSISDFSTYYYIPKAVLHIARPEHPYSNLVPYYPFFYPPQSIPLFGLLSYFPLYMAKYLWTIINVVLSFSSIYIINSFFNKKIGLEFWVMILGMVSFFPFQFTITDGQFNIVIFFIFVLIALLLMQKDYFKLSIPLAVGVITKISPLVVLLYLIIKKKYKAIFYTLLFILFFTIIAEVLISKGITVYYLRHVLDDVSKQASTPSFMDQSILGLLRRFEFSDLNIFNLNLSSNVIRSLISYAITGILVSLLFIIEYFKKTKSKSNFLIIYSSLVLIGLIGTGLAWYHQFIVLLLPIYVGFLYVSRLNEKVKYLLIGFLFLAYILMSINFMGVFKGYLQLTSLFAAVIGYLVLIYVIKYEPKNVSNFQFSKVQNQTISIFFLVVFVISINPLTLGEVLKEGRDRVRVRNIDLLGGVLSKYKPDFKQGEANSFNRSEKVDEGYILFQNAQGDFRQAVSILPLDPINNKNYNFSFESKSKNDFVLATRLESKVYLQRFGQYYRFACVNDNCSTKQDIE